jgi:hypothetical protein
MSAVDPGAVDLSRRKAAPTIPDPPPPPPLKGRKAGGVRNGLYRR